jgi:O-methyltransferase
MLKKTIRRIIAGCGYEIKPLPGKPVNPVQLRLEQGSFESMYDSIKPRTAVSRQRCFMLYQFAAHARALPGDAVEVGVYKGGTARLLAGQLAGAEKTLYVFDTFEGLPSPDEEKDTLKKGDFGDVSFEEVRSFLSGSGNVNVTKGFFPESGAFLSGHRFCFAHVDVDLYRSVLDCCEFLWPRMNPGGVVVFDDYGDVSCPGAKQAVDEFFSDKPERPVYLPTGQCMVTRHPR